MEFNAIIVTANVGDTLKEATKKAIELAVQNECIVIFNFNDIRYEVDGLEYIDAVNVVSNETLKRIKLK